MLWKNKILGLRILLSCFFFITQMLPLIMRFRLVQ